MKSELWLIFLIVLVMLILLSVFVIKAEDAEEYYKCFNQKNKQGIICQGMLNLEKCRRCPYYKRFIRHKDISHRSSADDNKSADDA